MNEIVQEWIAKAEGDYLTASREVCANPPNYDAVCFHAQQCIEKLLKAILIAEGKMPPRTHDLTVLDSMLRSVQPDWHWPIESLRLLSQAAITFRYPGESAIKAGRLMIHEINGRIRRECSFAFETTLSGRRYKRLIPQWQSLGYQLKLVFLRLPSYNVAIDRVSLRVQQGGHHVPEAVVRRRFRLGWDNFNNIYKYIVDAWVLYDNSGNSPLLVAAGENV